MRPVNWARALLTALLGASCAATRAPPRRDRPPNFVVVFADDLGYADIGPFGARDIPTPNLDRMAREGLKLTSFYVAQAVCSASRAALLTGSYSNRVSVTGAFGPRSRTGLHPDEVTIAEVLRARGYATAIYGKWHLGDAPELLPTRQGFDEYFGLPYSNDMWPRNPNRRDDPPLPLFENERVVARDPDQAALTAMYTERAVRFIERNKDRPFFLYVPHAMPHVPIFASARHRGRSPRGLYGDVVAELDWSVGEILAALGRNGLDQDTVVVFTSDNGPWLSYGDHAGSAGPLREGKQTAFEGGVRVPAIVRWPGRIPAGGETAELATTMDLLPTFARLAGAALPAGRIVDGKDVWPLLSGRPGATTPHDRFFYYWGRGLEAVRSGRWKLHFAHRYRAVEIPGRDGAPGKMVERDLPPSLFDLVADPGETTDLSGAHPDVVARLRALGEGARAELGDSLQHRTGSAVRPAARVR